jgi:hypothetical protein
LSPRVTRIGVQAVERAIAGLVEAGLSPENAFDTYSAVSVHVRGSVVLHRLREKNAAGESGSSESAGDHAPTAQDLESTPLLALVTERGHHIGAADDKNFEFGLECILDHASRSLEASAASAKAPRRGAKGASARGRAQAAPR